MRFMTQQKEQLQSMTMTSALSNVIHYVKVLEWCYKILGYLTVHCEKSSFGNPEASDAEINDALKASYMYEFVERLPEN